MNYTSYFANEIKLPEGVIPISICGKAPFYWKGLEYKKLAPKYWFFKEWKKNHDNNYYIENFQKYVLDKLNPDEVWKELNLLTDGKPFALMCYEHPDDFCHRHLVSAWLRQAGYEIEECPKPYK